MRDESRPQTTRNTGPYGDGKVLILGEPRSGTSWLAKLFDSHPDVLYRHEPDIVHRPDSLPKFMPASEEEAYIDTAREYLNTLAATRTLKSAGPLPVFPKRHRSGLGRVLRTGLILGVRGLEMAARGAQAPSRIPIPDLVSPRFRHQTRIVIKSVSLLGHARLIAKAWPQSKIVIIVRHPCGQVASFLQGGRAWQVNRYAVYRNCGIGRGSSAWTQNRAILNLVDRGTIGVAMGFLERKNAKRHQRVEQRQDRRL